jgi:methylmalonyl-CoA/ethylmalonyl-CoA epimerase
MNVIDKKTRVAFAVGDLEKARAFFEDVLGARFDPVQDVKEFHFEYQPFRVGGTEMQLMSPYDQSSVVSHFLMNRGQGFHHVTFEVADLDGAVRELEAKGIRIASRHAYEEPLEGSSWKDAFIHPRDAFGVLIQLIQKTQKSEE